jgi:Holliday junction resolvasome RuvABC endonuclease subunit
MAFPANKRIAPDAVALRGLRGDITDLFERMPPRWHAQGAPRPYVVAFDPGASTGLVGLTPARQFWTYTLKAKHGRIDDRYMRALDDRLAAVVAGTELLEVGAIVAIEDVFVKASPRSTSVLAFYVGAILGAASRVGLPAWRVPPSQWQGPLLGRIRRAQGKALSRSVAQARLGRRFDSDHEADAACLALYVRGPEGGVR